MLNIIMLFRLRDEDYDIHKGVDMFMLDCYLIIHVTRQTLRHRHYVIRLLRNYLYNGFRV